MNIWRLGSSLGIVCLMALLAGCATTVRSTPIVDGRADDSTRFTLVNALPKAVPKHAIPFPHGLYLFAAADTASEFAVSMLVPIPFVTDAVLAQMNKTRAEHYKDAYIAIDPYRIASEVAAGDAMLSGHGTPISLHPYVVVQECADGQYRSSLIFQATDGKWLGRYLYSLPTPIPRADFAKPSATEIATFTSEMREGTKVLISLLERDARGQLQGTGKKVDLGSYFVVGAKPAGLVSPDLVLVRGAEVLQESEDHVIVRSDGDPTAEVGSLGLQFGVHYFKRNQLHTFRQHQ